MPPELPTIYENPRFDSATPTFKPVIDRALRFGGLLMIGWGGLTLIEDAPRYLSMATLAVAVLILAVHESWPWLYMRDKRIYPILMTLFITAYIGIFSFALWSDAPMSHNTTPEPRSLMQELGNFNKSRYLGLNDAMRWNLAKKMMNSSGAEFACRATLNMNMDQSEETQKSIDVWSELIEIVTVAGWKLTQHNNRTFFPPGISIYVGTSSGPAFNCATKLKEFLEGLNVGQVTLHQNEARLDLIACKNECMQILVGKLESP